MPSWLKLCAFGARECLSGAWLIVLWAIWLGLGLLLAAQTYIATSNELAVPGFLLRQVEERLTESGLRLTFGRTSFDPTGRVLIEDVRLFLPAFPEPVLTTRAVFLRFNPRALFMGNLEPTEIHAMDATVAAPAQLSPSGRTEEILGELEATLVPQGHQLLIRQLSARFANLTIAARGAIPLPAGGPRAPGPPLADQVAARFSLACRQLTALQEKLARFEAPALQLEFTPLDAKSTALGVTVLTRRLAIDGPLAAEADDVVASTRLIFPGEMPSNRLDISASEIRLRNGTTARGVSARVEGRLGFDPLAIDLREVRATVDHLVVEGVDARAVSARLQPLPFPRVDAEITAFVLDAPLRLHTEADLGASSARIEFAGAISPRVLDLISQRVGTNVRRYYEFESLAAEAGIARFGPGWKFERLTARIEVPRMNSYGVIMEDGRATVELEPGRFYSPEAYARVGANFANGTYEHNLRTHEYRFLLAGQLRPLAISPWFGAWWPNFFRQFEFSSAAPIASVDVIGQWRQARMSKIFVVAETPQVAVRGASLDLTRARLFIRPGYIDGLELVSNHGEGEARGTFTYRATPAGEWDSLTLDVDSTFGLPAATALLGPNIAKSLTPYRLSAAPAVKVRGTVHGPGSAEKNQDLLRIEARTSGDFHFYEFPLQDVSFSATLAGSDVTVDRFNGTYAGGAASGNARVWGAGAGRRVGFNVGLENASLGEAAAKLQAFLALQRGDPPPAAGRFVQERANLHLNIAASAEGAYNNPFSFHGDGNAVLKGTEIGEVPLLGLLSELFTFTSLRFTEARSNFKIDGPKLVFPKIELRGANSAIDAHGDFTLDRSELNFTAKVYPFQESANVFKSVVGVVLTPLSNVLEVKLTGSFEKPRWAFVMGPRNFLRALTEGGGDTPKSPEPAPAPAPSPTSAPAPDSPAPTLPAPLPEPAKP